MGICKDLAKSAVMYAVTKNPAARVPLKAAARAGRLPKNIYLRLPVQETLTVCLPNGGTLQYAATRDDVIGRHLFWSGLKCWEAETTRMFFSLGCHARLVLDIGANTGIYSLLACAANIDSRVIAFEPVPRIHRRLTGNIRMNGWEDRCDARCEAVSDAEGTARFHVPFVGLPTSSSLDPNGFRGYAGHLIDVRVRRLDDVVPPGQKVDLVKLDIEGFEDRALNGMPRILSEDTPDIFVECNPDGPYAAVAAILSGHGYSFYHLTQDGPVATDGIIPDASEAARNYLCSTRPQGEVLQYWQDG